VKKEIDFEVIVPDNGSSDGSVEMVKKDFPWVKKVLNIGENLGFASGNNKAKPFVSGKYVLFLNSDTVVYKNTLSGIVKYLDINKKVGAATCRVLLKNGKLDKDTRRSFITPWIGLTHIYLKLDRISPKSSLFAKYWYGYIPDDQVHEVDALQGAFFLVRKKILDKVGWFDEDYFLDGEDIDLSWKIKNAGWKILKEKLKYRLAGVNSMELFYRKRLWDNYPLSFNFVIIAGIRLLKLVRIINVVIFK
jgi:GT2 family glycosyltransferase